MTPLSGPDPLGLNAARPVDAGTSGAARRGAVGVERASFDELLARARAGEFTSGLPVTVARHLNLNLNEEQLARLAIAADRAQAAGAQSALVRLDGQWLRLDIPSRTVVARADVNERDVLTGIDAVLAAPESRASATPVSHARAPGSPGNPSLLEILARGGDRGRAAG